MLRFNQPYVPLFPYYIGPYPIRQLLQGTQQCENFCGQVFRPVCGSDGQTYSSNCILKFTNCLASNRGEKQVQIAHYGKCYQQVGSSASDDSGFELEQLVVENEDDSSFAELEQNPEDCPSSC